MSLDVYLTIENQTTIKQSGIYIREDGQTKEITLDEWRARYPDREPVMTSEHETSEVYSANITGNLYRMAKEAGLSDAMWDPIENGITTAEQLIDPLQRGLDLLKNDPDRFKWLNPVNGWGTYDGLVSFVENYITACKTWPSATVSVWR